MKNVNLNPSWDKSKDDEKKDNETGRASAAKVKVDSYPKANEATEVETIDTDNYDEKKVNETAKVDPYPRANEIEKLKQWTLTIRIHQVPIIV